MAPPRSGRPVAVGDLRSRLEDEADVRAYDEAKADDDGSRFTMNDILAETDDA
ncbi:MAG: antitoxin PHD [Gordonia sp. (in: high G+C Gram-positive bacteria)]